MKRALIVTGVVMAAEASILFLVEMNKRNTYVGEASPLELSSEVKAPVKPSYSSANAVKAARTSVPRTMSAVAPSVIAKSVPANKPAEQNKTPEAPKPIMNMAPAVVAEKKKVVSKAETVARKQADKPVKQHGPAKQLSQEKMWQIYSSLLAMKREHNMSGNCVRIIKASGSNVSNAFAIAKYLQGKGFVIAGRVTVEGNQKGLRIFTKGDCLGVLIGAL